MVLTSTSDSGCNLFKSLLNPYFLRFDYIARDCHAIGEKGNLSLSRLIHSARVIDSQICYDVKDANQLYELCYTRFSLHKRIYNHKTGELLWHAIFISITKVRR
jgi:HD superfamily phosphohydrolase